jgi:hypothetical protein
LPHVLEERDEFTPVGRGADEGRPARDFGDVGFGGTRHLNHATIL